ncbi:MAG: phosphomethylpyrimidine synthase ThiC, partial [Betaproteobacteria bacterium]|nr:phosphomethylpyrimidine synthase ThiC [Betaproteobacteria bacterium]
MPKTSAQPDFNAANAADFAVFPPLPNSRKIYKIGSRPDIRAPFREITLSPTAAGGETRINPPFCVYDTSGPYTDPDAKIDIRAGLPKLRAAWIEERGDTEMLAAASQFGRAQKTDDKTAAVQFPSPPPPRRAKNGKCATQMHYARRG